MTRTTLATGDADRRVAETVIRLAGSDGVYDPSGRVTWDICGEAGESPVVEVGVPLMGGKTLRLEASGDRLGELIREILA